MFIRVIKSNAPNKNKEEYLELYFPKIVDQIAHYHDQPVELLVECLVVLNELVDEDFPPMILLPRQAAVLKCASQLLSFRKRIVRKFARVVINSWS